MKTRLTVISITEMFRRRRERRAEVEPARDDERTSVKIITIVQAIIAARRTTTTTKVRRGEKIRSSLTGERDEDVHRQIDPSPIDIEILVVARVLQRTMNYIYIEERRFFLFDADQIVQLHL